MLVRRFPVVAVLSAIFLWVPVVADAGVVDNTSLASPPGVYFGSGNANSNFTVDDNNGIELGLSGIIRYVGPVVPTPTDSNVYDVPLGATTVGGKTGSAWGFDFSINLQPPGSTSTLTLGDITALLTLTDVGTGTTGSFDPLLIPDNAQYGAGGVVNFPDESSSNWGAQNSEALSFASVAGAFGDPGYNMNANDTYIFTLAVDQGTTLLASDQIVIDAGTGAPEPASWALLGVALIALGWIRRRHTDLS